MLIACYENVTFFKGQIRPSKSSLSERVRKEYMSYHKKHNILGDYCWDCRKRTEAEIPGWPKSSKDDGPKDMNLVPTIVVWADGTEDVSRECGVCTTSPCSKPVHKEEYAEVNKTNELR